MASYELKRALRLAMTVPNALEIWRAGEYPLAPAAIADFDASDAAAMFDATER